MSEVTQSCWRFVTLWTVACQDPPSMGFFQARILEWVAVSFSRGIFPTQGLNLGPLNWEYGVLATGWPGKSPLLYFSTKQLSPSNILDNMFILFIVWFAQLEWNLHEGFSSRFSTIICQMLTSSQSSDTVKVLVTQSCLTLCDSMDCGLPGSVHGILQARILEYVAIPFLWKCCLLYRCIDYT